MQERRRYLRRPLAVLLEMITANRRNVGKGFITNLSENGLAMETSKSLHPGQQLVFHFSLPNDWKFDILGEIVYARDGVLTRAYGACFADVSAEHLERLKDFLMSHLKVQV